MRKHASGAIYDGPFALYFFANFADCGVNVLIIKLAITVSERKMGRYSHNCGGSFVEGNRLRTWGSSVWMGNFRCQCVSGSSSRYKSRWGRKGEFCSKDDVRLIESGRLSDVEDVYTSDGKGESEGWRVMKRGGLVFLYLENARDIGIVRVRGEETKVVRRLCRNIY